MRIRDTRQSLILPDSTNVFTTNALLKALGGGEEGFETLSDVLIAILQVNCYLNLTPLFWGGRCYLALVICYLSH